MTLHKNATYEDVHVAYALSYANAAARTAASLVLADIGKIARQADDGSFWIVLSVSPTTWGQMGTGVAASDVKAGTLIPGVFSGSPKKATVTFGTAFPSTAYAVALGTDTDGTKSFATTIESKTASGFTVNLNTNNVANLIEIGWSAIANRS